MNRSLRSTAAPAVRAASSFVAVLAIAVAGCKPQPRVVVRSIAGEWTNTDTVVGLQMLTLQRGESTIVSGVLKMGPMAFTHFSGSGAYDNDTLNAVLLDRQTKLLHLQATASAPDSLETTWVIEERDTLPLTLHRVTRHLFFPELPKQTHLQTEFDKFRNYSSVSTPWMRLGGSIQLLAFYSYSGRQPTIPEWVTLMLSRSGDDWAFLTNSHLTMLLDDTTRLDLGDLDHKGTVGDGYVLEDMSTRLSLYDFLRIVNATKIEGELNTTQFIVSSWEG